jgi:hypothetical protein
MSETESFEDTMTNAARLLEAGHVFSRASVRAFQLLMSIKNVRRTIEKTMPFGQQALELENINAALAIFDDSEMSKIFTNPAEMRQEHKSRELAKRITVESMTSAVNLVSAASLVFAHAVFDATLFDFCRVTALWSWREWLEVIKDRKVSVAEVDQATKSRTLMNTVDKYVEQLERESVLKKADMLHKIIIKPGENYRTTVRQYEYSRDKLELIDRARHEAVHRLRFRQGFTEIDATVDYLLRTVVYFMGLVHRRYGVKIDANVSTD